LDLLTNLRENSVIVDQDLKKWLFLKQDHKFGDYLEAAALALRIGLEYLNNLSSSLKFFFFIFERQVGR
jgi:hypothetical protein